MSDQRLQHEALPAGSTHLEDELRVSGSHFLDVHPSLRASNHDGAVAGAIHQDGEVGLPADVQGLGHHHLAAARRRRRGGGAEGEKGVGFVMGSGLA